MFPFSHYRSLEWIHKLFIFLHYRSLSWLSYPWVNCQTMIYLIRNPSSSEYVPLRWIQKPCLLFCIIAHWVVGYVLAKSIMHIFSHYRSLSGYVMVIWIDKPSLFSHIIAHWVVVAWLSELTNCAYFHTLSLTQRLCHVYINWQAALIFSHYHSLSGYVMVIWIAKPCLFSRIIAHWVVVTWLYELTNCSYFHTLLLPQWLCHGYINWQAALIFSHYRSLRRYVLAKWIHKPRLFSHFIAHSVRFY